MNHPGISVVGADGYLGAQIANHLEARRIVFGKPSGEDIPFEDADKTLANSGCVINASGFRVRPGLAASDYQKSHGGTLRRLGSRLRQGTLLIHFSSASVMGANRRKPVGPSDTPDPGSFPIPGYAQAKLDSEKIARDLASEHGFSVAIVRPAVVYSPGGEGMIASLARLALRGFRLVPFPARAMHHFCSIALLQAAIRRLAEMPPPLAPVFVADPFCLSNAELSRDLAELGRKLGRHPLPVPFPVHAAAHVLAAASRLPLRNIDLATWSGIVRTMALNTVYDVRSLWTDLKLDPEQFSRESTWLPALLP